MIVLIEIRTILRHYDFFRAGFPISSEEMETSLRYQQTLSTNWQKKKRKKKIIWATTFMKKGTHCSMQLLARYASRLLPLSLILTGSSVPLGLSQTNLNFSQVNVERITVMNQIARIKTMSTYVYLKLWQILIVYPYLSTPPLGQDMTQGQFLSRVQQVSIQSFPSSRLVAKPSLKNPVCPTIYP